MMWSSAFLAFGLFNVVAASPPIAKRWGDIVQKHAWSEIPQGWEYHSPAPADHKIDLRIGLKQDRFDELISSLYEVSDPSHARYGAHLSKQQVDELIAPHPDSVEHVESWLKYHGVDPAAAIERTAAGEWITIRLPVAQVEQLLSTKYNVYHHYETNAYVVRTVAYSLPRVLHGHIDVVSPTTYFGSMKSMRKKSFLQPELDDAAHKQAQEEQSFKGLATVPASCGTTVTISCLRTLYNTVNYVPTQTATNKLGVAGYLNEFANRADLKTFLARYRPDAAGATYTTTLVNGGKDTQSDPGVEANLDIQYTVGISYPTPNTYYSTGGSPPFTPDSETPTNTNEPYLDWLNTVLASSSIPQVISTSYGDDEQTVPLDYAVSVCNLFAQLGARGTSVFFASGDEGVGAGSCASNTGTRKVQFQPEFPSSCPYVTSVGGTTKVAPEVAVSFSGGGFSNYFIQPSYQTTAVNTFLTALGTTQYAGLYNRSGRAYPDLAAAAQGFQVVIGGSVNSVGGTSASTPTVAGIVSLLNDYRLSLGKSSLGFLNPLIYANPGGFVDIVSGSNPGCSTAGFTARAGWDPVTGNGTPDFVKLQAIVKAAT